MRSNFNFKILFFLIVFIIICCDGTLGGFNTVSFPVSKKKLENSIDSLYFNYPNYKIPDKYQEFNNWEYWGANSLDAKTFYFSQSPEEMYYISFVGDEQTFKDTTHIDIAIRSVFEDKKRKWLKQEDYNKEEETRIQERFKKEIISKLEKYTNSKSRDLGY
jgi:hypothetical protein